MVFAEEEWNEISKDEVIHLFHSIPERLKEIIRNQGHHIKLLETYLFTVQYFCNTSVQ